MKNITLAVLVVFVTFLANAGIVVKLGMTTPKNQTFTVWHEEGGYTTAFNAVADKEGHVSLLSVVTAQGSVVITSMGYARYFDTLPIVRVVNLIRNEVVEGSAVTPLSKKDRRRWEKEFRKISK